MAPRIVHQASKKEMAEHSAEDRTEHTLAPRPPFCFKKAREVMSSFYPGRGQMFVNDEVQRAMRVGGHTVLATIVSHGSIEVPKLVVNFVGDVAEEEPLLRVVADLLSIDDDLEPLYQKGLEDPIFGMLAAKLYGLHQVRFVSPFASACWAIFSAHTAINAASSMQSLLLRSLGYSVDAPNGRLWAYPEPNDILAAGEDGIGAVVRNGRKARYILKAAEAFSEADTKFLRTGRYDEVYEWLMDIEGIGPWGASLVMIRGLGRMERLPEKEKALVEAASKAYGRKISEEELTTMSERYGQMKGYWAYYLRVGVEASIS